MGRTLKNSRSFVKESQKSSAILMPSEILGDSGCCHVPVPGQVGLSGSSQCRLRRLSGAQAAQPAQPFAVVAEDAVAKPMVDREETSRSVVPSAEDLLSHFSQTKMNISRYVVIS